MVIIGILGLHEREQMRETGVPVAGACFRLLGVSSQNYYLISRSIAKAMRNLTIFEVEFGQGVVE
jgi:hypothetical protein